MTKHKIYRSPLFYVGDKFKLVAELKQYFPEKIEKFVEPFAGGGSVFLNIDAKEFLLNDIDTSVFQLHNFLIHQSKNPKIFFQKIEKIILEYNLSHSYIKDVVPDDLKQQWKKTYYAKYNKASFQKLKSDFNSSKKKDLYKLYVLLIFGFNRMLRFNSKGEYNLPVGNVDFNQNVLKALNDFFNIISTKNIQWNNTDYKKHIENIDLKKNDFVYLDPPYLITFSEYNKFWNEEKEKELVATLDNLNKKNIRFAVSNVTHYKGQENKIFSKWASKYRVKEVKSNYISYHDNTVKTFKEVLVTNYQ